MKRSYLFSTTALRRDIAIVIGIKSACIGFVLGYIFKGIAG